MKFIIHKKYDMWFVRLSEDMWYDRITFVNLRGRHLTLSPRRAFETWNFALPHANAAELLGGQGQDRWAIEDQTSQRHQKILTFEIAKGSVQRQMNHKILWVYGVCMVCVCMSIYEFHAHWCPHIYVWAEFCQGIHGIIYMSSNVPVTQKDRDLEKLLAHFHMAHKSKETLGMWHIQWFSLFLPGNCWCLAPSSGSICSTPT